MIVPHILFFSSIIIKTNLAQFGVIYNIIVSFIFVLGRWRISASQSVRTSQHAGPCAALSPAAARRSSACPKLPAQRSPTTREVGWLANPLLRKMQANRILCCRSMSPQRPRGRWALASTTYATARTRPAGTAGSSLSHIRPARSISPMSWIPTSIGTCNAQHPCLMSIPSISHFQAIARDYSRRTSKSESSTPRLVFAAIRRRRRPLPW